MDCLSQMLGCLGPCLWDCTAKRAAYIRELQENLDSLKSLTEELTNLHKDVLQGVEREEQLQRSRRTHEVDGWLRDVQRMQGEVAKIVQNGDQEIQHKCLGGSCPKNCRSSYKLGKAVTLKIAAVRELKEKGRQFDVVVQRFPPLSAEEIPMGNTVGLDSMFQKVRNYLQDDGVRRIGLYGSGGVGKTTLMKKINNDYFCGTAHDFDVVIWVEVVSKPIDIEEIQKVILKKLGAREEELSSKGKEEMAAEIYNVLKAKKFAILLDNLWGRLDLSEVGIPTTTTRYSSKVVLTAQTMDVCNAMEVDKRLKVECLTPDEAFSLFCDKVGQNALNSHPDVRRLARTVAEKCGRLPIALVVVGRSMASRTTPREWEQAIKQLDNCPTNIEGMESEVYPILKFSYDHLDNETIRSCFRYCSLFPKSYVIGNKGLIDLWIGEGFLEEYSDIYDARRQGEEIIRRLKLACLLEGDTSENTCKMHDVIHGMALWIVPNIRDMEDHEHKSTFLVLDHVELSQRYGIAGWGQAQRIALIWHSGINSLQLPSPPLCFANLQTLILRKSYDMKTFPIGLFQNMPKIRVLDLEGNTKLEGLPLEICSLGTLEYLNLSITGIKRIPQELKNLINLRCLILDHGHVPPPNVISCLKNLRMFIMVGLLKTGTSEITRDMARIYKLDTVVIEQVSGLLDELESLSYLSEFNICLSSRAALEKLFTSPGLQTRLRMLQVNNVSRDLEEVRLSPLALVRLRILAFDNLDGLKLVQIITNTRESLRGRHVSHSNFVDLAYVVISRCHKILELTWLINAPRLEVLIVRECNKMEEIIGRSETEEEIEEQHRSIFSRLEKLRLVNLPNLRSIHGGGLQFPSLKEMAVRKCPNLKKLPLNSSTRTNTLKYIKGESSWWEELQWEDDTLNSTFTPFFQNILID